MTITITMTVLFIVLPVITATVAWAVLAKTFLQGDYSQEDTFLMTFLWVASGLIAGAIYPITVVTYVVYRIVRSSSRLK